MKKWILGIGVFLTLNCYAETTTSGFCGPKDSDGNWGSNCEWSYDKTTKTLKIWGQGATYSTGHVNDYPWSSGTSFYNSIENVVIENGITSLGAHAFYGASSIKSITLPNSLKTISARALSSSLTSITIPENVTSIQSAASYPIFSNKLTSLYCAPNKQDICRRALETSGVNPDQVLKIYQKYGNQYYVDGKFYSDPLYIGTTNYIKKRIYTVEEATLITKPTGNTFNIRYR